MKKRLSFFCMALMVLLSANVADAQLLNRGGGQQAAFQNVSGDLLQPGLPGRLWISTSFADEGLGFSGNYFTIGGKSRLFQDRLDGRWLMEGQVHHSIEEDGGFFANVGIERVFSVAPANADVSFGLFYDYDGDDQQDFSNGFHQLGVSGAIKTERWDLLANGYLPVGTEAYTLGDHTGAVCFVGNNLARQAGIESALQGFDLTLRTRPRQLAFVNGTFDIGAYHYDSEIVDPFGGGRLRLGFQVLNGLMISAEVNHDDRFDTTGVLSAGWVFGAQGSGYGNEWAGLARDLERTNRQDHIVRFSQDLVLVVDPDTGVPYNVVHANNTALAAAGDGSFETPFATLQEAQDASVENDIIFVAGGDGTTTNYDTGIQLKDNQILLSNGGTQLVPTPDGTLFQVSKPSLGAKATISNPGGNEVVRLANDNTVGGIAIDGTGANFGIFGQGITNGTFNDTMISGAGSDGIGLQNTNGDFAFNDNMIFANGRDGIFINGAFDPTSQFSFRNNSVTDNGRDGIHMLNYDASVVELVSNITSDNGRHGVNLENALNSNGTGTDLDIFSHVSDSNGGDGVRIFDGNGRLRVINPNITNNAGFGLNIRNWVDPLAGDSTFIGGVGNTAAVFEGNGSGIQIELEGTGLVQDVLITQARINGNGRGLLASAEGENTVLNLNIIDNISISQNRTEGIRQSVDDGGTINSRIENTAFPLQVTANATDGGGSLSYVLNGLTGDDPGRINSVVRNVDINTGGAGAITVDGTGNSQLNLDVADSTLQATVGVDISLDNTGDEMINRTYFDNVIVRADTGITGNSQDGTLWDFSLTNSDVQSNGVLAGAQVLDPTAPGGYGPYSDTLGDNGIIITANGGSILPGNSFDNLTRVNLVNNVVRDFTFSGINIQSFGDAQLLANVTANQILNNGPGENNDTDNDGIFETPSTGGAAVNPTESFFFDGLVVQANGNSTLSARISSNTLLNNFQQGIRIQTTGFGTVNAVASGNQLSNDIGGDVTNPAGVVLDQNQFDMAVVNAVNGNICLSMSANTFRLPILFANGGLPPSVGIGLDGASNGFTDADLPATVNSVGFGLCDDLVTAEELFFQATGGFPLN